MQVESICIRYLLTENLLRTEPGSLPARHHGLRPATRSKSLVRNWNAFADSLLIQTKGHHWSLKTYGTMYLDQVEYSSSKHCVSSISDLHVRRTEPKSTCRGMPAIWITNFMLDKWTCLNLPGYRWGGHIFCLYSPFLWPGSVSRHTPHAYKLWLAFMKLSGGKSLGKFSCKLPLESTCHSFAVCHRVWCP